MAIIRHDKDLPEGQRPSSTEPAPERLPPEQMPEGIDRFSWRTLWGSVLAFFQLERGLLHTFRDLIVRPQVLLRTVLFEKERDRYTNPVAFLLLSSALVVLMLIQVGHVERVGPSSIQVSTSQLIDSLDWHKQRFDARDSVLIASGDSLARVELKRTSDEAVEALVTREIQTLYVGLMTSYYNALILFSIPLVSLLTWLLFRRSGLHYVEHLVVNSYILAMQNLIFVPLVPVFTGDMRGWASAVYMILSLVFQLYVYLRFFQDPQPARTVRAVASTVIGLILYGIAMALIFAGVASLLIMRQLNA